MPRNILPGGIRFYSQKDLTLVRDLRYNLSMGRYSGASRMGGTPPIFKSAGHVHELKRISQNWNQCKRCQKFLPSPSFLKSGKFRAFNPNTHVETDHSHTFAKYGTVTRRTKGA